MSTQTPEADATPRSGVLARLRAGAAGLVITVLLWLFDWPVEEALADAVVLLVVAVIVVWTGVSVVLAAVRGPVPAVPACRVEAAGHAP